MMRNLPPGLGRGVREEPSLWVREDLGQGKPLSCGDTRSKAFVSGAGWERGSSRK